MDPKSKMLVDATHPEETRVVVLRNGRVEEFDYESAARKPLRGNIYLAKVTRVEPSLQAAFVDYGGNRHGFLAFSEIHPDYYQIPFADRQALLQEEAEAEAAAEAEADARAEARAHRQDRHSRGGYRHNGDGPSADEDDSAYTEQPESNWDNEPHGAAPAFAHSDDEVLSEPDAPTSPDHERTSAQAEPADTDNEPESDAGASDASASSAEGYVEEIGSDSTDAPEDIGAAPEQVGSQDALEEVPERPRRRMRSYKIQEVIKRRQIILVQVVKEERGSKGAALTTYLSLAGRYTVLMPNTGRGGGISRKITNPQDRKRLKAIATELEVPEGMGLIVRTAGASRTKQELKRDFEYLLRLWENVRDMTLQSTAPCLVYEEGNLIKRSIRDLYTKDTDEIQVAGEQAYREAQEFMRMLSPSHAKNVIKFEDNEPLFARYNIERQLNAMFSPYVTLRSGGYLVINQTEALVSIDVNSGKATREFSIEETALQTNLEAAEELARQLKLRDLAGLIVIDFIDMEERRNNRKVEARLKDALRHDRARIQVGRISHFGLLEMSRQRLRTGVVEGSTSQCPHCQGTGIVRSTESVALAVLRAIEDQLVRDARSSVTALTTADVALYILNNKRSYITEMERRHGVSITVEASPRMQGANFAIEKSAAPVQKAPERSTAAVNMAWGFEPEDAAQTAEESEEQPAEAAGEGGDGRRRRRRRRGRREDRGEQRAGGEDAQFAGDGEAEEGPAGYQQEEAEPDDAYSDAPEGPAGTGEQPSAAYAGEEERDDRRGRRRRRGRRGGRRGREARPGGEPHSDGGEVLANGIDAGHEDDEAAEAKAAGPRTGAEEPSTQTFDWDRPKELAVEPADMARAEPDAEPRRPQAHTPDEPGRHQDDDLRREQSTSRDSEEHWGGRADDSAPRPGERGSTTSGDPAAEAEAEHHVHSASRGDTATVDDDPSRPARKGWWQRRFSDS
jgi:ribonuclease E